MADKRIKLKGIQRQIAQKMSESKRKIPHVTTIREIDMDKVMKKREQLEKEVGKISIMTFMIKAVGEALTSFPRLNSSLAEDNNEIIIKEKKNIGFAVEVEGNLIVPVIKDIGENDFLQLNHKIKEIIEKAKNRKLTREDFKGGTFTISNSGALGGEIFTPIINYPESAILGMGRIQKKPTVNEKEEIVVHPLMYLCLSYDHRIINGGDAVQFLGEVERKLTMEIKEDIV